MDIGSAFTYVFDDEEWIKKLAIGGGIFLAGIILSPILVGLLLLLPINGYMLEVLKNVRDGSPRPLPEWTDFGGLFKTGAFVFVIWLVYNIPALLIACAAASVNIAAPQMNQDMAENLALVAACLNCIQTIVSIICNLFVPAAYIRFAQFGELSAAFQIGEVFNFMKANIGDYIIAILLVWVASIISAFGLILCIIGVFFTAFWATLVSANLYGQLARKAQGTI